MLNTYPLRALFWVLALLPSLLSAQLTVTVTSVPANTPASAKIYVTGTFNNWNPGDVTSVLTPTSNGRYTITLNPAIGPVRFKFTRGGWTSVEGNSNGDFIQDHVVTYTGLPQTVEFSILSWEDLAHAIPNRGVTILDNNFYIPQLNRTRRVWIYLPLIMKPQPRNIRFCICTMDKICSTRQPAFSGEWEVDESLDEMCTQGDYGCIVVGVDNGGVNRLNEYSPWINQTSTVAAKATSTSVLWSIH
ncbi:MAG: hypothetical protein H6574_20065 [Lewinellaceae bacterium]|nr:hypothetical protein [Lewinellaceae bacterium]